MPENRFRFSSPCGSLSGVMATQIRSQTDRELLRAFAVRRSESAFRQLTEQHVDLVFGTALRRTGDRGAAEEITQNVFLALARKAAWIHVESSLASWLHRTTLLEARQWWRGEHRRRRREETAAALQTTMKSDPELSEGAAALIDEALMELKDGERQALMLRYFEQRNHREIGEALGIGEDAARKRVDKALRQMSEFFRARGVAVSSVAVAATMEAASCTAPAGLAMNTVRAVLTTSTHSAWSGKLLGLGKAQLAGLCLVVFFVPIAWQHARFISAQGEERRLAGLVEQLQSEHSEIRRELSEVERRTAESLAQIDLERQALNDLSNPAGTNINAALFVWNEESDYVRVPKDVLNRILIDGLEDEWGLETGSRETFDKIRKRVSPAVLEVLGVNAEQQRALNEVFNRRLDALKQWAEANSYVSEFAAIADRLAALPNSLPMKAVLKFNDDTRVLVTPGVPDNGEWREQFQREIAGIIGDERAKILMGMARDDQSLAEFLHSAGGKESYVIITPNPDGGFWLSHNSDGKWLFNALCAFSEVLEPKTKEPFDEAAVRAEMTKRIAQRRAEFPNEAIPPLESIVESARYGAQRTDNRGVVELVLGRPLPSPLVEYLRQWRAAHPTVPDSALSPRHP